MELNEGVRESKRIINNELNSKKEKKGEEE